MAAEEGGHIGDGSRYGTFVRHSLGFDNCTFNRHFRRKYNLDPFVNAMPVQTLPHGARKGTVITFRDIRAPDCLRIKACAGPHTADQPDSMFHAVNRQVKLRTCGRRADIHSKP